LSDFLRAAEQLLKNQGRFYLVFLAERLTEVLVRMQEQRIEPKRLRMVHSRISEVARLVLVEGRKNGRPGMKVESSLIIYRGQGRDYTEEVLAMYGDSGCGTGDSGRVIRDSKVSPPPQLQLSKASSA
jgi:tRNA1Val (adenine37-N6)-methyltransferase